MMFRCSRAARRAAVLTILLSLATAPRAARAVDLEVPTQYPSIAAALAAATPGDRVLIAPGVYTEMDLDVGFGVTVEGAGAPFTRIEAPTPTATLMRLAGGTVVRGLMFAGGDVAIDAADVNDSVVVEHCQFEQFEVGVSVSSGLVALPNALFEITDNVFDFCEAGIHLTLDANVDSSLVRNTVFWAGTGVLLRTTTAGNADIELHNNLFANLTEYALDVSCEAGVGNSPWIEWYHNVVISADAGVQLSCLGSGQATLDSFNNVFHSITTTAFYYDNNPACFSAIANDHNGTHDAGLYVNVTSGPNDVHDALAFLNFDINTNDYLDLDMRLHPQSAYVDAGIMMIGADADGSDPDLGVYGGPNGVLRDYDLDLWALADGDCDDWDPRVSPAAPETCNGIDDDCDGTVDDGFDVDLDGYTTCGGDCDDAHPDVFPTAPEICDGIPDNDCDGGIDPADVDVDGDGQRGCEGDCDDGDVWFNTLDEDGDGATTCGQPADCDDFDAALNPADADGDGESTCDGDCDDGDPAINGWDADGDGVTTCDQPPDCDDGSALISPDHAEVCGNGVDDDCDGLVDGADPDCGGGDDDDDATGDDDDTTGDDDDTTGDDDDATGDDDDATGDDDVSGFVCDCDEARSEGAPPAAGVTLATLLLAFARRRARG